MRFFVRSVAAALCLLLLAGCGSVLRTASVKLVSGGAYGKAIFVVSPVVTDRDCAIEVDTTQGPVKLDCNSEYIVACDIDIPLDRPFCQLVREIGTERDSAYPKQRRQ